MPCRPARARGARGRDAVVRGGALRWRLSHWRAAVFTRHANRLDCSGRMEEIIGEMAATVITNPTHGDDDEQKPAPVDTDAVLVPDYFTKVRPLLCRADGSPRSFVQLLPLLQLLSFLVFASQFIPIVSQNDPKMASVIGRLTMYLMVFGFILPALFVRFFYAAIATDGYLDRLGIGRIRVSAHALGSLRKWLWFSAASAGVGGLFGVSMMRFAVFAFLHLNGFDMSKMDPNMVEGGDEMAWAVLLTVPTAMPVAAAGFAAGPAWYLTLKIAVCLSQDDVIEVVKRATPTSVADDDKWAAAVAQPALALGKSTMKHLSAGWGVGTALAFLICWIISFANFLSLIHNSVFDEDYIPVKHGFTTITFASLPLIISADVAHVSSMCDELLNSINELKMTWSSTEEAQAIHARVFPLQTTLLNMNQGQGLGVSFKTTID
jgi:hypothetical protein